MKPIIVVMLVSLTACTTDRSIRREPTQPIPPQVEVDPCVLLTFPDAVGYEYRFGPGCDRRIRGDVNGDGVVNSADIILVLTAWGNGDWSGCCHAYDTNDDQVVNVLDLLRVLKDWNS